MNDKTGKQIATAIADLAKAIDRLASTERKAQVIWGGNSGGTITGSAGGIGGSPGGVSPRLGGGGGGGPRVMGGAALSMVGEAGPEYLNLGGGQYWLVTHL